MSGSRFAAEGEIADFGEPSQGGQKQMAVSGAKWVPSFRADGKTRLSVELVFSVPAGDFEKLIPPLRIGL